MIIWGRTAVSDALLCGTLGVSLLLFWRRMASKNNEKCISPWIFLGFAIFGFILPLILRRFGYDPAIAGGVVITTVTDIIGFVSFLGIISFLVA